MAPKQRKAGEEPRKRSRSPAKKEDEPKKEEPKKEEVKEEEKKFVEPDAPKDNRPAMKETIGFETSDTTLNVLPTVGGKVLTCLTDGGMANLLACARANVSVKAGRYMFEAKIIQVTDPSNGQQKGSNKLLRIGFSTSSSGLFFDAASSIYFDSDGQCVAGKKRTQVKNGTFGKGQVVAVVLNLDSKSPNFNTIALYRDGAAVGEPVPLPEGLQGKPLFPHLAFRSVSLHANFGPTALKPLPFTCRMLQGAATSDVTVVASNAPKDGKYEVMMPVAFPDEGTFEWLDGFLAKNPQYVELSDRKIIEWAQASGLYAKGNAKDQVSNDKPNFAFGVQGMDDRGVQRVLSAVAPLVPRNYLIMEVKSNLIAAERQAVLKKFNYPCYKKVARVIMGEPTKEFKATVHNKLLKDKQTKSDNEFKRKQAEATRKKQIEKKQKEIAKARKEAEKKRKAVLDEKKKKEEEAKKAKEGDDKKDEKEEDKKDEPMKDKAESDEEKEEIEEADVVTDPPVVELTDEEKKIHFTKHARSDLSATIMNASFAKFTLPDMDDGFDDIKYEWQKESQAKDYLQKWVLDKKLTTRIDNIRPGQTFKEKVAEFTKLSKQWQDKLKAFKAAGKKKLSKKDDEVVDDVDIFSVADVLDAGDGVPLFDSFTFEDWELMKLRFEFCLLVLSFKKDCNDADRAGIPTDHFAFYYNRYFQRNVNPKAYGLADVNEVMAMIKDTIGTKDSVVVSQLSDDLDNLDIFLKLTEEGRRERQRRIDAGDETARLKFVAPAEPKVAAPKPAAAKPAEVAAKKAEPAKATPAPAKKGWGKGKKF